MGFNFSGTATLAQWETFKAFTRIQQKELVLRKRWLQKELLTIGIFTTIYDEMFPVKFSATPGSYAAKLLQAYRILGGVPERDMLLRTRDKPVFLLKGINTSVDAEGNVIGGYSDEHSNGRRNRGTQRFDRDLCIKTEKIKKWELEQIKFKRERLEFKIKRALDKSDQIQQEIKMIDRLLSDTNASVDGQILAAEVQMVTPGTANMVNDLDDVFGLTIGKINDPTSSNAIVDQSAGNERGGYMNDTDNMIVSNNRNTG